MKLRLVYEGFLDFLSNHPEWMKQWKLNNRIKNIKPKKSSAPDSVVSIPEQDGGPFKRLPNVRNFKVNLGGQNKLLAAFGIETKFHPTFSYEPYFNYGMNKYFNYQIYRLRKAAKSDPKMYFKLVNNLLRYSKVLFVIGLNHVNPKGHRDMPLGYVIKLGKAHNKISQLKHGDAHHHRLYIDKANGKKRPLGVPEMVWRIYLHQVANFLSLYLEERKFFSESQHGFRTRLGTKTAGKKILKDVIKADGIYEFDLERCFPNIHIKGVSRALRHAKVPQGWIEKFEHLNMTPVNNPRDLRKDTKEANEGNKWMEQCRKEREESDGRMFRNALKQEGVTLDYLQVLSSLEANGKLKVSKEWLGADINGGEPSPEADLGIPEMFFGMDSKEGDQLYKEMFIGTEGDPQRGLPQGLPTSPLLTIASLEINYIRKSPGKLIMYADDGLIYGGGKPPLEEELITKLSSDRDGITINKEKSGFAKLPGQEIDLKFLGMRLKGDVLSAETRNGATLTYDKDNLIDIYDMLDNGGIVYKQDSEALYSPREPAHNEEHFREESHLYMYQAGTRYGNRSRGEKLASSKLFGMIQARLFQDGGNIPITQCFDLTYKKGSGVDVRHQENLTVFNSTSFAAHDLLRTLSKLRNKGRGSVA